MAEPATRDRWKGGGDYEAYVGRWSRRVARAFVDSLGVREGASWVDAGCGTGALTATIAARALPASVFAIDQSSEFVAHASAQLDDSRVVFGVGDAAALPLTGSRTDAVVSGLLLNFLPDPGAAVLEWRRVARPGAAIAAYVWDYAEGMEPIRAFWDAAIELDPSAGASDEAVRFPLCDPGRLQAVFTGAELVEVRTGTIDAEASFRDFADYWTPFLSGVGPAPGYCAALAADHREALRALLEARLSPTGAGPIRMHARAFTVRGTVASHHPALP